jgi:hypothetical protein
MIASFVLVLAGCSREPAAAPAAAVSAPPPEVAEPLALVEEDHSIQAYLSIGAYGKIDKQVDRYVATRARNIDGRPKLFLLEWDFEKQPSLAGVQQNLEEWRQQFPDSAYRPIIESMVMHDSAWRARGTGFSSTVTPEGWRLFHERSKSAWQILMDRRETSSPIPSWYSRAILTGMDAGIDPDEIRELFDEGIARHPGYLPIYFSYMRDLTPRWGGSFQAADQFIREQVSASTNVDGEVLYARLYWIVDQADGQDSSLFEDSLMSWPRMRRGFEEMMKQYPDSDWNRANFASYACRANDATAWGLLRSEVDEASFRNAAPEGISLDDCDAQFLVRT